MTLRIATSGSGPVVTIELIGQFWEPDDTRVLQSKVDQLIADATAAGDTATQVSKLQEADKVAGADGAYAPILNQRNFFIFGSKVGGFLPTVASSFYPDLGAAFVAK